MILNEKYYHQLVQKFKDVEHLENVFSNNVVALTVKMILNHYKHNKPIHINFQNSKDDLFDVVRHLYIELANDIYKNHYDLPDNYSVGDKLKRITDNQYYEIIKIESNNYTIRQILRQNRTNVSPAILTGINYERLTINYLKLKEGTGISERTIKNYFDFFEKLNNEKCEFPRLNFEKRIAIISKRLLWDRLNEKSKIPSIYLPNPREDSHLSETKSIPALTDCLVYFTPKYDVCYQNILLQKKHLKSIIVFDTEATAIEQMLLDKQRYGFNIIVLSNSLNPQRTPSIPCWNWFREEVELVNNL
jgi:hypothetical protein